MPDTTRPGWWKSAVIYQVYPKSFADTTGSGQGDLPGVTAHLDYLADLGTDLIWLSPIYASPQKDNGYDVSDFRVVDPRFGTMADFAQLVEAARRRGMGVLMDMVLNHTSSEHAWFRDAKSLPESPWRDFYIWSDRDDGSRAVFGDPAWNWSPEAGRYYYSSFSPHQPDLDWRNPAVRSAVFDAMQFWLDQGVSGFRLDAVPYISKDLASGQRCQGPALHTYLQEMRSVLGPQAVLFAEDTEADIEDALLYTEPSRGEINAVFEFGLEDYDRVGTDKWQTRPLDLAGLKAHYARWQEGLLDGRGWMTLFTSNHDMPRVLSRWGAEGPLREQSAKALATAIYLMRGTPVIYQGEELGMTNLPMDIEDYDDLETVNYYRAQTQAGRAPEEVLAAVHTRSRDNARTPMQWTDGPNAGFTSGSPWLPVNPNYVTVNARAEGSNPGSVLSYYRNLLRLRKEHEVFAEGSLTFVWTEDPDIFAYTRSLGDVTVGIECNLSALPRERPFAGRPGRRLLGNCGDGKDVLEPYEARVTRFGPGAV